MTTMRCTRCGSEFTEAEVGDSPACPKCGTKVLPMDIDDDVTIRINWHELRVLGMWADMWADIVEKDDPTSDAKGAVTGILRRIKAQHPERSPLTLMGEFEAVQEKYPEMEVLRPIIAAALRKPHADGIAKERERNAKHAPTDECYRAADNIISRGEDLPTTLHLRRNRIAGIIHYWVNVRPAVFPAGEPGDAPPQEEGE